MTALRPALTGTPVLETARLILRAPETADFEAWADYIGSDRARFTGGPQPRAQAWRSFCGLTGHWVHRGYGMFVAAPRAGGPALGLVGPWFPEGWPGQEIGWILFGAGAEGKGLAFEAAQAARAHAYDVLGWPTAISLIDTGNSRSEALARRMGCTPEGTAELPGFGPTGVWRHPAPDALAEGGMEAYA
jgi:RimJ/RimL family protein N-acetyltransferase